MIGEWGKKKKIRRENDTPTKQKNTHIARQSLRMELLSQLPDSKSLCWGHQLIDFSQNNNGGVDLIFQIDGKIKRAQADLVVGADGIRSIVRKSLIGEEKTPLQYSGLMVILGICSLDSIRDTQSPLLDSETVFQTVNGHNRIYMMPYSRDSIMWQMSFPMTEDTAHTLSIEGSDALKQETIRRISSWHTPIPQILSATCPSKITGYPVYDREILTVEHFKNTGSVTLIGDAAHPMAPFKGQGANRALLDALSLARYIHS